MDDKLWQKIEEFFDEFKKIDNLKLSLEKKEEEEKVFLNLGGEDSHLFLEREGELLIAFQHILNKIVLNHFKGEKTSQKIIFDCSNFRESQARHLRDLAFEARDKVLFQKEAVALKPLKAFERRIIHLTLQDDERVKTASLGEGQYKRVIVSLV